jgi:hypothetical protein
MTLIKRPRRASLLVLLIFPSTRLTYVYSKKEMRTVLQLCLRFVFFFFFFVLTSDERKHKSDHFESQQEKSVATAPRRTRYLVSFAVSIAILSRNHAWLYL